MLIDNQAGSNSESSQFFQMSGDGTDDVSIPVVFLFSAEANQFVKALNEDPDVRIYMGKSALPGESARMSDCVSRLRLGRYGEVTSISIYRSDI